jgi:hypothetical protein
VPLGRATLRRSFALSHPDHLGGVLNVVEPGDFAGGVELPEMTVDGERVVLALIRDLEGDEHEDLVTAVEEGMRFVCL